jgi:diadenosine tetraphosphate (Ap4A) HIT family hydrolase
MKNNEQFRKSITEVVNESYNRAILELRKVEEKLKENPRSFQLKEERIGALRKLQSYQHIHHHIANGNFDSVEYWDKYIDPMSEHKQNIDRQINQTFQILNK